MPLTKEANAFGRQIHSVARVASDRIKPEQRVFCFYGAKSVDIPQRLEDAARIVIDKKRGKVEFVGDILWLIGEAQTQNMVM